MQQEQNDLLQSLYEGYQGALRFVAYRSGIPYDEIDDMIQDVFVSFISKYGEVCAGWNDVQQKSMLMRILRNRVADHYRSKHRHTNFSLETGNFGEEFHLADTTMSRDVLECITDREDIRKIQECVQKMKPDWYNIIALYFIEGRPVEEVSKIMGISTPTLRMRVSRIRKYLREQIGEAEPPKKRSRQGPKDD